MFEMSFTCYSNKNKIYYMPWENLNNNTIFWFYIGTSTYM